MPNFAIITDSCCDLSAAMADELNLKVIPLTVDLDGKTYHNYLDGREISFDDFYATLPSIKSAKTAAANQIEFMEATEPLLCEGLDVLYIGFSSGLSVTYNNGAIAFNELSEKYPDRKLIAVDSLAASMGQGLLVWHAAQLRKQGKSIDEVAEWLEANKLHLCHLFTVNDLMQLKRGGRINAAEAIVGSILSVKPMLHVDNEGHLTKVGTVRGRKASIKNLADGIIARAIDLEKQTIFISHGGCRQDAELLADMIRSRSKVADIMINYVGPVIGSHSGIGTLALFFLGTER